MYVMVETRPNIAYAVSVLSRFLANPLDAHLQAVNHVLRYINVHSNWASQTENQAVYKVIQMRVGLEQPQQR
jgi:hypothetical protein